MQIGEPQRIIQIEPQPHQLPGPLANPERSVPVPTEEPQHEREPEPVPA